jgi:hypothetical protein
MRCSPVWVCEVEEVNSGWRLAVRRFRLELFLECGWDSLANEKFQMRAYQPLTANR